jgi:hypothetical protein
MSMSNERMDHGPRGTAHALSEEAERCGSAAAESGSAADAVGSRLQPVVRLGHCMHWLSCTAPLLLGLCRPLKDCHGLHHGVSANLLYGFERFNL